MNIQQLVRKFGSLGKRRRLTPEEEQREIQRNKEALRPDHLKVMRSWENKPFSYQQREK